MFSLCCFRSLCIISYFVCLAGSSLILPIGHRPCGKLLARNGPTYHLNKVAGATLHEPLACVGTAIAVGTRRKSVESDNSTNSNNTSNNTSPTTTTTATTTTTTNDNNSNNNANSGNTCKKSVKPPSCEEQNDSNMNTYSNNNT